MVRVEVLGPLRVVDAAGVDVSPRGRQQRRALVALASCAPEPVTVDQLEDVLWPDGAPSGNALQATVSKLRRLIAPATIDGDAGRSYAIVGAEIDLIEFERAVADERWSDAEHLVAGRPLADLDDHQLVEPVIARVHAGHRRARAARLTSMVSAAPASAAAELEELVATESLDETWWALLVQAHANAGQRHDALRAYQRARRTLADELGLEPGPELRRLEAEVLSASAPRPTSALAPLPRRVGSFVGREAEVDRLAADLAEHRLVTVLGPGGVGKTTIALEVAAHLKTDAVFVGLANLASRHGVVRALALAAGVVISEQPGSTDAADALLERIAIALRGRAVLIVLDNCEHLVDVAAEIARELLSSCHEVGILATSRAPLGLPGERSFPLPPLAATDAAALLRARAADHGVALDGHESGVDVDSGLIASICERLDGIPLAIELAAARLRSMSLVELAGGLDDRFELLSSGPRQAEPRQQTLRAVVDWSHDLLDDIDRVVFRRLAAFVGGFTLVAAREVVEGVGVDGVQIASDMVAAAIERLVDQSLLVVNRSGEVARFSMLETLHDYAADRLDESGDRPGVRRRHAQWMADAVQPALRGAISHEQARWFEWLRAERANHRAALATAAELDEAQLALELVAPLGWYFYMAGELAPAIDAFERALSMSGETEPTYRALALGMYGWLLTNGPDLESAMANTSEAVSLLPHVDDLFVRGIVADTHVMTLFFAGQVEQAADFWPTSQAYAEQSGDVWLQAMTMVVHGEISQFEGRAVEAERTFASAAEVFERCGDRFAHALAVTEASELAELVGDYDRALEMLRHGVAIAEEAGITGHPLAMRARIANIEILRGNLEAAERGHRELLADAQARGTAWLQSMADIGLANIARRRGDYEAAAARFDAAWANPRTRTVPYMRTLVLVQRGYLSDQRGDMGAAAADQIEALDIGIALGTPRGIAFAAEGLAGALSLATEPATLRLGAELMGCADALRVGSGGAMPAGERYDLDRTESRLRAALGDDGYERSFGRGAAAQPAALAEAARSHAP